MSVRKRKTKQKNPKTIKKNIKKQAKNQQKKEVSKVDQSKKYRSKFGHEMMLRGALLDEESKTPGKGILNLFQFVLVLLMLDKVVTNYFEKKPLIDLTLFKFFTHGMHIIIFTSFCMGFWTVSVYFLTKLIAKKKISVTFGHVLYGIYQFFLFVVPGYLVYMKYFPPFGGLYTSMQMAVFSMKSHSYYWTNIYLKSGKKEHEVVKYPDNIIFKEFVLYLFYPTLVYEPVFPKKPTRSYYNIAKYFWVMFVSISATYMNINYHIFPILKQTLTYNFFRAILKLSVPYIVGWITVFYGVFHGMFNFVAEIFKFGDRQFYSDWWNAKSFQEWWGKWNYPVHEWFFRSIYIRFINDFKWPKNFSMLFVFLITALWHEFVVAMTCGFLRPWLSASIFLQLGLFYLTKFRFVQEHSIGNLIVWFSLSVGQPIVYLAYMWSYYSQNPDRIPQTSDL
ncbi:sterol o-acyltransferase [Anaeramoeba flamelloides]|uniref:O-acyltransferase n=1 Tax=Anaeramoeba flamelloides TaxID=1746091 RepID=A0AAV7YDU8_9EUKA|nr:sterol o-acyltransferase [Anaeramoeba flamelloides]